MYPCGSPAALSMIGTRPAVAVYANGFPARMIRCSVVTIPPCGSGPCAPAASAHTPKTAAPSHGPCPDLIACSEVRVVDATVQASGSPIWGGTAGPAGGWRRLSLSSADRPLAGKLAPPPAVHGTETPCDEAQGNPNQRDQTRCDQEPLAER